MIKLPREGGTPTSNPSPVYISFVTERYPFRTPSTDKWYPFHILVLNAASLLISEKTHCLSNMNRSLNENVFLF